MDYNDKNIEELLSDVSFRNWVLKPTVELELFWKNWLIKNPEKTAQVKEARLILKSLKFNESELPDKEKFVLLNRIKATNAAKGKNNSAETVVRPINNTISYNKRGKRKNYLKYFLRYAAILGGAIIFALSIDLFLGDVEDKAGVQLVKKINQQGQKSTIFLSDGTIVNLNSSSTIVYPKEFISGVREVKLNGEAFFKVSKDSKPFIVKMNNLDAKVLGTSFNARSFSNNDESSVSLVSGQVEVYPSNNYDQHIILNPGEKATLTIKKALSKSSFSYNEDILWKDGILFFKNTPLREALKRMEQWYGVKFIVDERPGQDYEVTGKFDNQSLESVLRSISFTLRFNYKIKGKKVEINL